MHDPERNKQTVLDFLDRGFLTQDPEGAFARYVGKAGYRQHNPTFADGYEGFAAGVAKWMGRFPNFAPETLHVIAEGEYVVLHSRVEGVDLSETPADDPADYPVYSIMDIFRLDEEGKVVEHWDVVQAVPDEAENGNGMF
jgi:predicted SnoaL-like aldol condensation-catalyzing enzyme